MATKTKSVYEVNGKKIKTYSQADAERLYQKEYGSSSKGSSSSSRNSSSSSSRNNSSSAAPKAEPLPSSSYSGGSIVDYLKGAGKDASFSSRAKLAVEQGIVSSISQYTGSAAQNTALLAKARSSTPLTPQTIGSKDDASAFINGNQDADMADADEDAPPVRKSASETLTEAFRNVTGEDSIIPKGKAPKAPNFEETYNSLRRKYDVGDLEERMTELDAEEQAIITQRRERTNAEMDKPVALNVISGRVTEVERQEGERLSYIATQKEGLAKQLSTANAVIETTMNLKKLDYTTAKEAYDSEFTRNIQMFNVVKGLYDIDMDEKEQEEDNARANLQIIYNSLKEGDGGEVSPELDYTITKLELEAGLPSGFYKRLNASNPEGKVLSTTTRTVGGAKYADILTKNKDGSLSTQSIRLGATNEGSSAPRDISEAELTRGASARITAALDPKRGSDGYVAPDDYKAARNAWMTAGFTRKDFDDRFADEYVNPASYEVVGYRPY